MFQKHLEKEYGQFLELLKETVIHIGAHTPLFTLASDRGEREKT